MPETLRAGGRPARLRNARTADRMEPMTNDDALARKHRVRTARRAGYLAIRRWLSRHPAMAHRAIRHRPLRPATRLRPATGLRSTARLPAGLRPATGIRPATRLWPIRSAAAGPGSGQARDHPAAAADPERHLQRRGRLHPHQSEGDAGPDRHGGRGHADHHAGRLRRAAGGATAGRPPIGRRADHGRRWRAGWRRWAPALWSAWLGGMLLSGCSPSSSGGRCSVRRSPSAKRGPRSAAGCCPCSAWQRWKAPALVAAGRAGGGDHRACRRGHRRRRGGSFWASRWRSP